MNDMTEEEKMQIAIEAKCAECAFEKDTSAIACNDETCPLWTYRCG